MHYELHRSLTRLRQGPAPALCELHKRQIWRLALLGCARLKMEVNRRLRRFFFFFQSHLWLIYTWPSCCMILHSQTSLRRLRMLHSSTPGSAKLGAEDDLIPNNPRLRNQTKPVPAKQRWAMMAMPQTWNVNGEKWEDPRLMHCKTVGEMELLGSRPL